jgi:hypothetical protein
MKPLKLKLRVKWEKWVEGVIIEERIVEKKNHERERGNKLRENCVFLFIYLYLLLFRN